MRIRTSLSATAALVACVMAVGLSNAVEPAPPAPAGPVDAEAPDAFRERMLPFVENHCVDCHSSDYAEGGIVLDRFADGAAAAKDGKTWLRVRKVLEGRSMPPADMPQPTAAERDGAIAWIEDDYLAARCGEEPPPGPVVIRRLNRQEYDNTIRDLLGLDLHLAEAFPADEIGFGFDNVGSALSISPVHVEKYLDAAELALDAAIRLPDAEGLPPIELIGLRTYPLPHDAAVEFAHALRPGRYLADFSLVRAGVAESVPAPRMVVSLGADSRTVEAARVQDETVVYRFWIGVAAGDKLVRIALAPGQSDREEVARPAGVTANVSGDQRYGSNHGLHVDSLVVRGPVPLDADALPAAHRRLLGREPGPGDAARTAAAREVVAGFAGRAFRRDVPPEEVDRLMGVFRLALARGECYERAVQVALTGILASPRFLYLVEPEDARADRPLDDHELASRLSYFLWSSMPDDALFAEARAGTLRANLRPEVSRMLADPKAEAFVANFVGQWLQLRRLAGATPDPGLFPGFDDALRASMRRETELYFAHILRENRSVLELIDSDFTFLDGRLARHYGIAGVEDDGGFRRVDLADGRRGGVMTQASVLTLTSNPNRTSPVKRGQWVLQQLLGTPPPPPPPDVPKLDEGARAAGAASLRERLEVHRANPACASCHSQMDPLGFALENYDAIGRWRTRDGEFPIDASGSLAGGPAFAGADELKRLLATSASKQFSRCLVENLLTYALGRGLEPDDYCTVEALRKRLQADGFRVQGLVFGIVESRAFQHRGAAR
jgi:mono/diheme cytochrome c family protein